MKYFFENRIVKALWCSLLLVVLVQSGSLAQSYTIYPDPNNTTPPTPLNTDDLHPDRVNLVILAEGYLAADQALFETQRDRLIDALFTLRIGFDDYNSDQVDDFMCDNTPFHEYRNYFNIYSVFYPSCVPVGCVDHTGENFEACGEFIEVPDCGDPTITGSHFGFHFDNGGLHRLVMPDNPSAVVGMVQGVEMFDDNTSPLIIAVLANTGIAYINDEPNDGVLLYSEPTYFGAGGMLNSFQGMNGVGLCVTATTYEYESYPYDLEFNQGMVNDYAIYTLAHEIGHAFANVLDEYWYDYSNLGISNTASNRWDNSNPGTTPVPWQHWLNDLPPVPEYTIGLHHHEEINQCNGSETGTTITDFYKPNEPPTEIDHLGEYCKMGNADFTRQYCAVCKEAIIMSIWGHINAVETTSPDPVPTYEASSSLQFELTLLEPDPSFMEVKWYFVDGQTETAIETDQGTGFSTGSGVYQLDMSCSLFNGLDEGDYVIRAKVLDMGGEVGSEWIRHPDHQTLNEEIVTWTVHFSGEVTEDLWLRDFANVDVFGDGILYDDIGEEPWSPWGWFFWRCHCKP